jgi:5-methyltetrahydropteroyltriglutamate--homocysteine methyltransferase
MVRWPHFLTPVIYFSKLLGMSKFAAFPESEIFRIAIMRLKK